MAFAMEEAATMGTETMNKRGRRSGGRSGRIAVRSAPLADNLRPVRPGLPGGQYKPLTEDNVARIHGAALDALER